MKSKSNDPIDRALAATSRQEARQALGPHRGTLSAVDVKRLTDHLRAMDDPSALTPVKIALLRTYATEMLKPYWPLEAMLQGLDAHVYDAPYGVVFEEAGAGLADAQPDVVFVLLRLEDLHPSLSEPLCGIPSGQRDQVIEAALAYVDSILASLRRASSSSLAVVSILPRTSPPELGLYDATAAESGEAFRQTVKRRVAERLRVKHASVLFDDLDELVSQYGQTNLFDARLWLSSRFPWSLAGAQAVVRRMIRYAAVFKRPRAKVIVLDADNTLWGGILGEDGPTGIALGPDYPGSAFVAFQRRLLEFQQRGILLAVCSKNNPEDVREVLREHPHQVLRESHFSAVRVNWQPKVENLRSIAEELNLGLDSLVYVDDSLHECYQVRQELPQVAVVTTPQRQVDIPGCLDDVPSLEILSLTSEDRERTKMYAAERQRKEFQAQSADAGQYLRSLKMVMTVSFAEPSHLKRIAQLTQKTNQFNLTTRRYVDADIERRMSDPSWLVADFSLADTFGDSGIVGVAMVKDARSETAELDTFLMSCRVIGRGAETAFLKAVLDECAARGARRLRAEYLPTRKNALVQDFLPRHNFTESDGAFALDLSSYTLPETGAITVDVRGGSGSGGGAGRGRTRSSEREPVDGAV